MREASETNSKVVWSSDSTFRCHCTDRLRLRHEQRLDLRRGAREPSRFVLVHADAGPARGGPPSICGACRDKEKGEA